MNFNASGGRHPSKLGAKRMGKQNNDGMTPNSGFQQSYNPYGSVPPLNNDSVYQNSNFGAYPTAQPQDPFSGNVQYGPLQQQQHLQQPMQQPLQQPLQQPMQPQEGPGFTLPNQYLSDPLVSAAAMTYGHFVGSGKKYVDKEIEKYVPVSRLKYYFAVDTSYVYKKLGLIFFPFTHRDWSVKYSSNEPVQPRYEVNAPDLYIPTMAYLTYVLVAGLALGTQDRFTPEVLGIQASSALAWTIFEVLIHLVSIYVSAISTSLTTIDILAFSGYKFVGVIFAVLSSLVFFRVGYYLTLIYFSVSLSFFLIRTLKVKILPVNVAPNDPYSMQQHQQNQYHTGEKRRLYLLLFISGVQPFLMWWLSYHLVPTAS
ncbi:hypothetical protein RUM44_001312 [Polyplax serrata]|uniref:Protein YIF1 n=1 Tax=Polyplax serrata TaxID=468196 RepID=A0ABR1AJN2_POLSC